MVFESTPLTAIKCYERNDNSMLATVAEDFIKLLRTS